LACKHSSLVDRQNRVWFGGCFGHINSFENGVWTVHDNYSVFGNTSFTAIFQDNQNRMWLGTSNDIYIQNDTSWIKNDFLNEQDVIISDIKSDSDEHIWLAGYFDYDDIRGGCLIKQVADSFELMYPKSHIGYPREIAFNEDKIWLGKSYLSFFDGETWNNSFTANNISSEKTTSICTDTNGDLWYGTSSGLFKQTAEQAAEQILQLCGEDITGIQCIASYNNCLWIKTLERNLYKFDGTEWSKIDMTNAATSGFLKIVPRDENEIWITSTLGALKYDGTNWTIFTTDSGLMSNSVNDIAFQNDSVWIATIRGIALVYNQEVSILHNDSAFVTGFSRFNAIKVDKNGTKWAGCINGVLKFDDFSSEYLYPTGFEEEIYSITLDPNDNIWFCGKRAVSKYTFDNSDVEHIRTKPKFLTFYPNPANDEFSFELPIDIKTDILEIYNTNGAIIYQQKVQAGTNKIDIGNLPVGMYLVRIRGANLYGKFVKE
ncbi:MAG TPA: two-component regulator propeller domain-containing protein, partial [Bacteroidales bacterium]|nr:two-component regulator propeller domain-containing protein [Bacteroidales bacterium]